ncbi:JAB domain-containing protein [Verrucomicrobiota bacterium sgz303538]
MAESTDHGVENPPKGPKPRYSSQIRVVRIGEPLPKVKLDTPEVVSNYYRQHIASGKEYDPDKEHLYVFGLDTKYQIKGVNLVSVGSLNESVAHPREIFRPLIALAAYAFILVHNHPSGDATPSEADRRLTARLHEAAKLLQIQMLDHVVMGEPHFSFREAGLL